MDIKAIIFDCGGVMIDYPVPELMDFYSKYFNISIEKYLTAHKIFENQLQISQISEQQFWQGVCSRLGVSVPDCDSLLVNAIKSAHRPKPEMFSLAALLKKNGYKVGLLSNIEPPVAEFISKQDYNMFHELIFSSDVAIAKPDRRIYEISLKRLNVKPNESVFIDDIKENTNASKELGMNVILFENPEQVRLELVQMGVNFC